MLSNSISQLGVDQIEWLKVWVLIPLYILATVGVWLGVWLEERSRATKTLGWRLLLISLAAEILFGAAIFVADANVSSLQRLQIAALDERLAARTLLGQNAKDVSDALSRYVGQEFEINGYQDDQESVDISDQIALALRSAGWRERAPPPIGTYGITDVIAGVRVYVSENASPQTRAAAGALASVLRHKNIDAKVRPSPTLLPSSINVTVGIKP